MGYRLEKSPRKRWVQRTRHELGGKEQWKRRGKTWALLSKDKDIMYLICCQECMEARLIFQVLLQFGSFLLVAYVCHKRKSWSKPVVKRKTEQKQWAWSFTCLWPWTPISNIPTAQIMRTSCPLHYPPMRCIWISKSNPFLTNLHLRLAPQLLVLVWTSPK